ncbi:distal tail protein Dit [Kroppenstedtia guangzhouensis]|nr:distal tail protein Dit [Kroppenstedtia guangzhouensis]
MKKTKIPGLPGDADQGVEMDGLEIPVEVILAGDSHQDYRAQVRKIAAWLYNGGFTAPLIFDDEPDKKYLARLSGSTDLEQIIAMGRGDLVLYCPNPIAIGKTTRQQISGIGIGEMHSTVADFSNGTLRDMKPIKMNGTGELHLSKYADAPWKHTVDWSEGTYSGMMKTSDGKLTLERGEGAHRRITTTTDWNGYSENSNTKGDSNKLILDNLPLYYMQDDMSAYRSQGWNDTLFSDTRLGTIEQKTGYMSLNKTGTGDDSTVMVFKNRGIQALDRTVLLHVRTTTSSCRFQFVDNGLLWNVFAEYRR